MKQVKRDAIGPVQHYLEIVHSLHDFEKVLHGP